ncbi:MAG TPA: GspE/PulE family protein, partial [Burkholderiaceae bacterium]|nr:GspE/PulE family protein [Burkholderiaceae bacterium]
AEIMSISYAERRKALPLNVGLNEVTIATCEPLDVSWVPEIEAHVRKSIKLVVVSPLELTRYTTEFYTLSRSVRNAIKTGEVSALASFEQLVELGKTNKQLDANDQGVVQVVDWLWQYAFDQRASDIHLEPRRERSVIRFRIDGVLQTVYQLPPGVMNAMIARVKLLGRMDVVEKRRPLDGRIKTRNPSGDEVEMRLATIPTAFGEKMVMRIFDPDTTVKTVEALGFGPHDGKRWEALVAQPHGIVLLTGPTGSGKTTTLYSTLKRLATEDVNVCTIEDPIEMIQPALNQTQVQPAIELNFAEGLRALMRQDPDIIMVGEIRDLETAEMAIQAALTGHLVFSTLHTNDASSAVTRLADLGVPAYLIGSTLIGVLAQRLVRTLCVACKQPDEALAREQLDELAKPWRLSGEIRPYRPVGCIDCRMTGYRGRAGLYELLTVTDAARSAIHPATDAPKLRRQAVADGLRPLRLAGLMKIAQGQTTLDEVLRATPFWEA